MCKRFIVLISFCFTFMYGQEINKPTYVHNDKIAADLLGQERFNASEWDSIYSILKSRIQRSRIPFADYYFDSKYDSTFLKIIPNQEIQSIGVNIDGVKKLPKGYIKSISKDVVGKSYLLNTNNLYKRLKENSSLDVVIEPRVLYFEDSISIYSRVRKSKLNSASGILGLNNSDAGKLKIQGELELRLNNVFNHLENIHFTYEALNDESQDILFDLDIPYLYGQPLGVGLKSKLFKQDSSFIDMNVRPYLFYSIKQNERLHILYDYKYSNSINTNCLNCTDFNYNGFGFSYMNAAVSPLRILPHRRLIEANATYGKVKTNADEYGLYKAEFNYSQYFKLTKLNWLSVKAIGAYQNSKEFYANNTYRIGGHYDLRGYNQKSVYTDAYGIMGIEYKFIPRKEIAFSAFIDAAFIKSQKSDSYDNLNGLGIGIEFIAKFGKLSLQIASPFNKETNGFLDNHKIHISIMNIF